MKEKDKLSLAQEIYQMTIKLNLETKRGEDSSELISRLKDYLSSLENSKDENFPAIRAAKVRE